MINASGVIRSILNGTITLQDFLRDMESLYQFSSGSVSYNFVVNSIISMGCRIVLRDEKIVAVPIESRDFPLPPSFMFIRKTESLPHVGSEPFAFLKTNDTAFSRLEIILPHTDKKVFIAAPWRGIISRKEIPVGNSVPRNTPATMLTIPVKCLLNGQIKLLRISASNYANTPADVLNGAAIIALGKGARRKLVTPTMIVSDTYDETESLKAVSAEFESLTNDYSVTNTMTLAQASLLRNVLDTRNRDAGPMQRAMRNLHTVGAAVEADE
jgi:hypothetical protein